MRTVVLTKPVVLDILFSISVIFVLQSVFFTCPQAIDTFCQHPQSSSQGLACLKHIVLVTNILVLGILVSIALILKTKLSNAVFWQHDYPLYYLAYLNQDEQPRGFPHLCYVF